MRQTDHVAHVRECCRYGVQPLSGRDVVKLHAEGLSSLAAAFSVASDLNAGFSWRDAVDAYKRIKGNA